MRTYPDDFINKIILGDCLEVMKDIPNDSIDLIVTDPPFGISYYSNRSKFKSRREETKIMGDEFVNKKWFTEMFRTLKDGRAIYCFCNWKSFSTFESYIKCANFNIKTPLIWDKKNKGSGDLCGDWGDQTEIIIFAVKGRHILQGNRNGNILPISRISTVKKLHPNEKPIELLSQLINKSSYEEQIVFDPFCGSGSTLQAAVSLDRNFIGIELDNKHYQTACTRIGQIQEISEIKQPEPEWEDW